MRQEGNSSWKVGLGMLCVFGMILLEVGRASSCAALKMDRVNWRKGPGSDHPIVWIYRCPGWPVIIERKFENWYFVRDHGGSMGWVKGAMLTFKPILLVVKDVALVDRTVGTPRILAYLKKGFLVQYVKKGNGNWCLVSVANPLMKGWLPLQGVWPCPWNN